MKKNRLMTGTIILLLIIAVSIFIIGPVCSNPDSMLNRRCIENLEEKQKDVLGLTVGASGISTAISLLPGDAGSPIANEFSDLVGYFILISSALFFEKYLVTVTGFLGFRILIPLGCILLILCLWRRNESMRNAGIKIAMFGLLIYLLNPMSYAITKTIEKTYETSMEETAANTDTLITEIQDAVEDGEDADGNEDKNWFQNAVDSVDSALHSLTGKTQEVLEKAKEELSKYVEATAIMIITSCVIPLAVIFVFIWLIRVFLGIRIESRELKKIAERLPSVTPPAGGPAPEHRHFAHDESFHDRGEFR